MKTSEVNRYHDIITQVLIILRLCFLVTNIRVRVLSGVVIASVDHKLLTRTLWLNDDILDKDWDITDLKPLPCLTLIPRVSDLSSRRCVRCSN